jgi:3-hydroxybutyryl-CoA dehydrogenase
MKLEGVDKIAIIGSGMIGASLSALFTGNGYHTVMYAINDTEAAGGLDRYRTVFNDLIGGGLVTRAQADACEKLLSVTKDYADVADADFVYECVFENKEVKYSVYAQLDHVLTKCRGIASTSSAMDTDFLCQGFEKYRDKFAVAHPWNPPHLVPCVEIVKGTCTSDEALTFICRVLTSCGRAPVVMNRSVPGFIANRLQQALYREAGYIVEQGIASPQDVDKALMTSFAPRYTSIGIFEHYDYAGLDMILSIEKTTFPSLCDSKEPHKMIADNVAAGNLGQKTGRGVLDWSGVNMDDFRKRAGVPYLKFFNWSLPEA